MCVVCCDCRTGQAQSTEAPQVAKISKKCQIQQSSNAEKCKLEMGASVNHAKYEHKEINMSANHIWFQLYIFNNCFIYSTMYREQLSATQRILKNVNLEKLQKST